MIKLSSDGSVIFENSAKDLDSVQTAHLFDRFSQCRLLNENMCSRRQRINSHIRRLICSPDPHLTKMMPYDIVFNHLLLIIFWRRLYEI